MRASQSERYVSHRFPATVSRLRLNSPATEPEQTLQNLLILHWGAEREREFPIRAVFVIHIVVPHVHIEHSVFLIAPNDRVIAIVPDFAGLWTSAQREA